MWTIKAVQNCLHKTAMVKKQPKSYTMVKTSCITNAEKHTQTHTGTLKSYWDVPVQQKTYGQDDDKAATK